MDSQSDPTYFFSYVPMNIVPEVAAGLFALFAIIQSLQTFQTQGPYYLLLLSITALSESVGYGLRILCIYRTTKATFIAMTLFLLLPPNALALTNYKTLGEVVRQWRTPREQTYKRAFYLKPRFITWFFFLSDVLSFLLQAAGVAISTQEEKRELAKNAVLLGLAVQLLFFACFLLLCIKVYRSPEYRIDGRRSREKGNNAKRRLFAVIIGTTLLLYVRSVYRVFEFVGGYGSWVYGAEWLFYVCDTLMVLLCFALYDVVEPSECQQDPALLVPRASTSTCISSSGLAQAETNNNKSLDNALMQAKTLVLRQIPGGEVVPQSNNGDNLGSVDEPQSSTTRLSTTTVEASTTSVATTTLSDSPNGSSQVSATDQTTPPPPQESSSGSAENTLSGSNSAPTSPFSTTPTINTDSSTSSDTQEQQQPTTSPPSSQITTAASTAEKTTTSAETSPTAEPTSRSSSPNKQDKSGDLSGGAIAGIVVGVVVFVILAIGAILLYLWYRRRKSRQASIGGDFDNDFPDYHPAAGLPPAQAVSSADNAHHGASIGQQTGMTMPASYGGGNHQNMVHLSDGYINDTFAYQTTPHGYASNVPQQQQPLHNHPYNGYS
ncbi:hypothetical protein J3B02_001365 [Coemansia erecta]|nr:hypothetical protein J3B02_001365 [Coemansia erecta]